MKMRRGNEASNGEVNVINGVLKDLHILRMWAKKKRKEEQNYLLMVFLEEVKFFFQAVQVSSQGGDDLLVVGLCLLQSNTVSLHRLTHHQLSLPPVEVKQNSREKPSSIFITVSGDDSLKFAPLVYYFLFNCKRKCVVKLHVHFLAQICLQMENII